MSDDAAKPALDFDGIREAGYRGIKIRERADGSAEFVLPALRNFSVKISFSVLWLVLTACLAGFMFFAGQFLNDLPLPGVIKFFILNHIGYFVLILWMFVLALAIACLDMWLRSSRVVVAAGKLQAVTHWVVFKRVVNIPAQSILEIRVDGNTSVDTTTYYDIVVLTLGTKPGWVAKNFPAKRREGSSFTENDLKVFNSGGKKLAVATGIEGKQEADWMAGEMRRLLKLDNAAPSTSIKS